MIIKHNSGLKIFWDENVGMKNCNFDKFEILGIPGLLSQVDDNIFFATYLVILFWQKIVNILIGNVFLWM